MLLCTLIYVLANENKNEQCIMSDLEDQAACLIEGAKRGDIKSVGAALDLGADIHFNEDEALRWAASADQVEIVELLLSLGADARAQDSAALRWTKAYKSPAIVDLLIKAGADGAVIQYKDNKASPAELVKKLTDAVSEGDSERVGLLIDLGAEVTYALHWAVHHRHGDILKQLLDAGGDIHQSDDLMLINAAKSKDPLQVEMVLSADLDPDNWNNELLIKLKPWSKGVEHMIDFWMLRHAAGKEHMSKHDDSSLSL